MNSVRKHQHAHERCEGMKLYYDEISSPVGPLMLIINEDNIALRIDFGTKKDLDEKINHWLKRYLGEPVLIHNPDKLKAIKEELDAYFTKESQVFTFKYKFYGTDFQKQVWEALFMIPYGETKTYKDIATIINNPKAVRAVGGAVNKNPFSIVAPCHRVIGMNGKMVGYGGGLDKKEFLLKHENYT